MQERQPPPSEPLIWATRNTIFAVEPETGALRWRFDIGKLKRLFRLGSRLFVLTVDGVTCLDLDNGRMIGALHLPFVPTSGIASGNRLYVAGPDGAAALTDQGGVLWSATQEHATGVSLKQHYICTNHAGQELWRYDVVSAGRYDNPGLVYGNQVAQPDLDSQ